MSIQILLLMIALLGSVFAADTDSTTLANRLYTITKARDFAGYTRMLDSRSHFATASAQTIKPLPSIEVTAPKDVATVERLNGALTMLSEKVTACVKAGGKPETCQCSDPKDLASLRTSYASLIRQHPDWKDQLLSYHRSHKEGRNITGTLVLENLRRQLETLKCE